MPTPIPCDGSQGMVTCPHGGPTLDQWMNGMGQSLSNLFSAYLHAGIVGLLALAIAGWIVSRLFSFGTRVVVRSSRGRGW